MASPLVRIVVPALLCLAAFAAGAASGGAQQAPQVQESFRFADVTLSDGGDTFQGAQIHVRVKEAGGGYTRADYFDGEGRRLGFYEAFEVVARDGAALRAWAVRNFGDRTATR